MRIRPGLALAKGLFQQAILESPGSMRPLSTLEEAERAGEIVGSNLAAMRRMSADDLLKKNDAIVPPVRRLTAPRALSILALGCGRGSPSAPTQNRTPTPAPAPVSMRYHVSGVATDDNGSPIANAEVAVEFEAGQSILISIDPDSSIAYDGEDWWAFDWVWERLHVRVADAGTLTIDARPEQGGIIPSLAVLCLRH